MASRLLSLTSIFNTAAKGSEIRPNSWATICAWRKYFASKESSSPSATSANEEDNNHDDEHVNLTYPNQQQQQQQKGGVHNSSSLHSDADYSPIQSVEARRARNEFVQGVFRAMYDSHNHHQQQQHHQWNVEVNVVPSVGERNVACTIPQ